jgi:hypothetical protein
VESSEHETIRLYEQTAFVEFLDSHNNMALNLSYVPYQFIALLLHIFSGIQYVLNILSVMEYFI